MNFTCKPIHSMVPWTQPQLSTFFKTSGKVKKFHFKILTPGNRPYDWPAQVQLVESSMKAYSGILCFQ